MNIKNVDSNVYRQYINSGSAYSGCTQKVFSINGKRAGAKRDSLSFSSEADLLRSNSKAVRESAAEITAGASKDRISELRRKIKDGEYNVGARQVADSILDRYV